LNAIILLEKHWNDIQDKICWWVLCMNDNAIPLLEKHWNEIKIDNWTKQRFVELVIESAKNSEDFRAWASRDARKQRNILSHTLGGINEKELFEAWGLNWQNDLDKNLKKWESRIVKCLNLITGQRFQSLTQASLFACTHHQIKTELNNYNLNTAEN
jgi:hypothetical protein